MSNFQLVPVSEQVFYKALDQFLQPLKNFSTLQNCLFSAACCERFVKFYKAFQERENWGDYSKIRSSLDLSWSSIENSLQINEDELLRALDDLEKALPDGEYFASDGGLLGGTACGSIMGLIDLCLGETKFPPESVPEGIFEIFYIVIGLGDPANQDKVFIGYPPELRELEISVLNDLRVKKEMKYQKEDMDDIISSESVDIKLITRIRERAKTNQWDANKFLDELNNR